ncbi:hypothetical protein CDIK_4175 [Cucumispora dikerogammari]|nr:hypothetical protein CDIK_4175 [Cucumispora dikerogammari]
MFGWIVLIFGFIVRFHGSTVLVIRGTLSNTSWRLFILFRDVGLLCIYILIDFYNICILKIINKLINEGHFFPLFLVFLINISYLELTLNIVINTGLRKF